MTTRWMTTERRRGPLLGLRPRVLGWYLLLIGLALLLTSVVTFRQADRAQREAVDVELEEEVRDFAAGIQAGRNDGLTPRQAIDSYTEAWPALDRDSLIVRVGADAPRAAGPLADDPNLRALLAGVDSPQLRSLEIDGNQVRALVTPLRLGEQDIGAAVVARLTQADQDALRDRRIAVLLATALAFLVASTIAWFTLGRLLRPVRTMAETADEIAASGDLTRRIEAPARADEVGQLASTFNRMLDRVEASFQREQRFIREASHELRTPITICRGHLEVLPGDPSAEEIREAIAVVVEELGRMGRILEDMSTLARAEDPGFVRPQRVMVERFLGDVARSAEPLLGDRLVVAEVPAGAAMTCDPQRLSQAVLNLLQNAALHSAPGAPVHLGAQPDGTGWRITVSDEGGGVPEADMERIFRPFVRGESRAPGSGLGLAIVRGIAEAHGGRAGLDNRPGEGATFWVTVPS